MDRNRAMNPTEPLPLHHSWPVLDRYQQFDLGLVHDGEGPAAAAADARIGHWSCELADQQLRWSAPVFDLFGLPRNATTTRDETIALYAERSRAAMERLRAYAIRHRRGFTLDVELRPATGGPRWMRLTAAPVCVGHRVVRLHGSKQDITALYG